MGITEGIVATLLFGFLLLRLSSAAALRPWQKNVRSNVNSKLSDFDNDLIHHLETPRTGGGPNAFRILWRGAGLSKIVIGGKDFAHQVNIVDLTITKSLRWSLVSDEKEKKMKCEKDRTSHCNNYIRTFLQNDTNDFMVCGTSFMSPKCRHYTETQDGFTVRQETHFMGLGRCPPRHNEPYTVHLIDRTIYSAMLLPAGDPVILRFDETIDGRIGRNGLLRTTQSDSRKLHEAEFVHSFMYGDKMYYIFREKWLENQEFMGPHVVSRIAQVCLNDKGGNARILTGQWTSFFKTTLVCSIAGKRHTFYFESVQSVSPLHKSVAHSEQDGDVFYALFKTAENSIGGSAICTFSMKDVVQAFSGKFMREYGEIWGGAQAWIDTGEDHPSICRNKNNPFSDKALEFIGDHAVMSTPVRHLREQFPAFVRVSPASQLTAIAVHWNVKTGRGSTDETTNIIFAGTEDGHVLKIRENRDGRKSVIMDNIKVFHDTPITELLIHDQNRVVVMSSEKVISMPLHHCSTYKTCRTCTGSQDVYCGWCGTCRNDCRKPKTNISRCPADEEVSPTLDGKGESANAAKNNASRLTSTQGGGMGKGELVAVVLACSLFCLAFGAAAGWILARRRSGRRAKNEASESTPVPALLPSGQTKRQLLEVSNRANSEKSLNIVQNKIRDVDGGLTPRDSEVSLQNNNKRVMSYI